MQTKAPPYRLHYWPFLQGRGEFVRLVLEYAELPYIDVARDPRSHATQAPEPNQGGVAELAALFRGETANNGERFPVFAPPILELENKQLISQVANILLFLGRRHGLLEDEPLAIAHANQLQLTIADIVAEIHDTHHPVSATLHYEDQNKRRSKQPSSFESSAFRAISISSAARSSAPLVPSYLAKSLATSTFRSFSCSPGCATRFPNTSMAWADSTRCCTSFTIASRGCQPSRPTSTRRAAFPSTKMASFAAIRS
jgi:glutathione S-transferase